MHIKTKTSQYRRDFQAIYACEHCGNEYASRGYDDDHFHHTVIPGLKCPSCKRSSDGVPTSTPDVPPGVHL